MYKEDKEGNLHLIKNNILVNHYLDLNEITGPIHALTDRGVKYKTRCKIAHKDFGVLTVKHKYEEVLEWKKGEEVELETRELIGFKTKQNGRNNNRNKNKKSDK